MSELIATNGKNVTNPIISADGKTLAFVEGSFKTNILQIEKDTSATRRLIESSGDYDSPNLSPDAKQIACVSNRAGNGEIWIADASGKNQRQLTDLRGLADQQQQQSSASSPNTPGSPHFSPDGRFVAYDAQIGGNGDIFVVSVNGGSSRRMTSDSTQEVLHAWSSD